MNQSIEWKNEDVEPAESGWYAVMRADKSLCLRAFGNGLWWIPLKDGWLSGLPPGFKWFGPLMPIDWDTPTKTEGVPFPLTETNPGDKFISEEDFIASGGVIMNLGKS